MRKLLNTLFSTSFAGLYIILFAVSVAVATFIENDYGTPAAQKLIYKAHWFELLLILFCATMVYNIFRFKLYRKGKRTVFLFHIAMVVILLGSGITRFFSFEGMMHIRENAQSSKFLSDETYVKLKVHDDTDSVTYKKKVLFAGIGKNKVKKSLDFKDTNVKVRMKGFYPNATEQIQEVENGYPILEMVSAAGGGGMRSQFIHQGRIQQVGSLMVAFDAAAPGAIEVSYRNDSLFIKSPIPGMFNNMIAGEKDSLMANTVYPFEVKRLYTFNGETIVLKNFIKSGGVKPISTSKKITGERMSAVTFDVSDGQESRTMLLWGMKGAKGVPSTIELGGKKVTMSYGSVDVPVPFSIHLRDFQLERYPGSNSPSSYASEVTLLDEGKNVERPFRIFMNNILNYRGYRFFQSSYDKDELGTYLSVNHDFWGTLVSYLGYFLLALGMFATIFNKKSRFHFLSKRISKLSDRRRAGIIAFLLFASLPALQASGEYQLSDTFKIVSAEHAKNFGKLYVQDNQGRTKPINTLSSQVLRKMSRKTELYGQNADQIFLGVMTYPEQWQEVPLIKVDNQKLKDILGVEGKLAAFTDFIDPTTGYLLKEHVEQANQLKPAQRNEFHKDVIKVDERVNIFYLTYSGSLLKIFPLANEPNNTWYTPFNSANIDFGEANVLVKNFPEWYFGNVDKGVSSGNWEEADFAADGLLKYQKEFGAAVIPSETKTKLEIFYNEKNIFGKLSRYYGMLGFIMLLVFFVRIFKPSLNVKWLVITGTVLIGILVAIHTAGLGIRWYVSGHAPWSNGYESMIYIAWATMIAGLIFAKKSPATLAVTSVLASMILMVAGLSWMDPEITTLVPVLKSYWLTIHVSMITASYGFLAMGALMAFLNLLLMIFRTKKSSENVGLTIQELTAVIEMALTVGLILLSVGTFLGGVWANESWGRYWGWDAKETWALVSILVYAFILHMRLIPGLKDTFSFNFAAVIGYAAIIMTYFGVNYYLSGLHSYATGDPVPIPKFVYYTLIIVVFVSMLAYLRGGGKEKLA